MCGAVAEKYSINSTVHTVWMKIIYISNSRLILRSGKLDYGYLQCNYLTYSVVSLFIWYVYDTHIISKWNITAVLTDIKTQAPIVAIN